MAVELLASNANNQPVIWGGLFRRKGGFKLHYRLVRCYVSDQHGNLVPQHPHTQNHTGDHPPPEGARDPRGGEVKKPNSEIHFIHSNLVKFTRR